MALHRGSVSFPLGWVCRGHRLAHKDEKSSRAFCRGPRQMATSFHSFLGNIMRRAELIAAWRAVEQGFRNPRRAPAHVEQGEERQAQEEHVGLCWVKSRAQTRRASAELTLWERHTLNGAATVCSASAGCLREALYCSWPSMICLDEQRLWVSRAIYPLFQTHMQGLEEKDIRAAIMWGIKEPQLAT